MKKAVKKNKKPPVQMLNPLSGTNGQLMAMAAYRYCLGRRSYIVGACIEWLRDWWRLFEGSSRSVMIRDIVEALQDENAGSDFDAAGWKAFAEWGYNQLSVSDWQWIHESVYHRNKSWPLNVGPERLYRTDDGAVFLKGEDWLYRHEFGQGSGYTFYALMVKHAGSFQTQEPHERTDEK